MTVLKCMLQVALAPVRAFYHLIGAEAMRRLDARFHSANAAGSGHGLTAYVRTFSSAISATMLGEVGAA